MYNLKGKMIIDNKKRVPRFCNKCNDNYYNKSDINSIRTHKKCTFCYKLYLEKKRMDEISERIYKKRRKRIENMGMGYVGENDAYKVI